jgi:glycosyltransferase involved in cell wall biosynthesis
MKMKTPPASLPPQSQATRDTVAGPDAALDAAASIGTRPIPEISVIIPIFNEETNIPALHHRVAESLAALGKTWEVVFVNDGSTDRSGELLDKAADENEHFTVVHFRRNFGQTAAISAGIRYARGEIIIPMDGDLQNDPRDIQRLLDKMAEGYEVVSGWRKNRKDPLTKRIPSRLANAVISAVTGVRLHDYGCSLKAYRREVLKDVFLYGEMHRFVPAYAAMRGARVAEIVVEHRSRAGGKSTYGLERIGKVLLDLIVVKFFLSFMNKPIHFFGGLGSLCMLGSFLSLLAAVVFKLISPDNPWGPFQHEDFLGTPLPLIAVLLAALGILMILQGVLAEMVMRAYYESQGKDPYVILRVRRGSKS